MIIKSNISHKTYEPWMLAIKASITKMQLLTRYLELEPSKAPANLDQLDFPIRVPLSFANRIKKGDWQDPLLLQVLWQASETQTTPGYVTDPLQEKAVTQHGLVKKYAHRALWLLKSSCAIHCRYCFRKFFPYSDQGVNRSEWALTLKKIEEDCSLQEIILSGGDPLMSSDLELNWVLDRLNAIKHLDTIRIHSRIPIVLPERITQSLCDILSGSQKRIVLVTHCNHPQEINEEVKQAIYQLKQANVYLLNQSVLLKNINNSVDVLTRLSKCLFSIGILPYYLHHLDAVRGTAHFFVSIAEGKKLVKGLWASLPGYLVPKWVQEQPGALSKTLLPI